MHSNRKFSKISKKKKELPSKPNIFALCLSNFQSSCCFLLARNFRFVPWLEPDSPIFIPSWNSFYRKTTTSVNFIDDEYFLETYSNILSFYQPIISFWSHFHLKSWILSKVPNLNPFSSLHAHPFIIQFSTFCLFCFMYSFLSSFYQTADLIWLIANRGVVLSEGVAKTCKNEKTKALLKLEWALRKRTRW